MPALLEVRELTREERTLLGSGKRLFAEGKIPAGLRLVDRTTATTGVIIATDQRASEASQGSFALEQPSRAELARQRKVDEEHWEHLAWQRSSRCSSTRDIPCSRTWTRWSASGRPKRRTSSITDCLNLRPAWGGERASTA